MTRRRLTKLPPWTVLSAMLLLPCVVARADEPKPTAPEPSAAQPESAKSPASLDDLLGLEDQQPRVAAEDAAEQARQGELDRALGEQELRDAFSQALSKMIVSADLLEAKRSTGLGTQRVQEEVLAKLDELIDMAQKMSSCSGGSGGSGSAAARAPRPQAGAQPPSQRPGQGRRTDQPSDSNQESVSPPRQEGDINTVLDESRREWGNLPQRIRDMMLQGSSGKFSSLYERLTQEYYRRLAEDAP